MSDTFRIYEYVTLMQQEEEGLTRFLVESKGCDGNKHASCYIIEERRHGEVVYATHLASVITDYCGEGYDHSCLGKPSSGSFSIP